MNIAGIAQQAHSRIGPATTDQNRQLNNENVFVKDIKLYLIIPG